MSAKLSLMCLFTMSLVSGLNPKLRSLRDSFDPSDRFNQDWSNQVYDTIVEMTDQETFFTSLEDEGDTGRPPHLDVIELTDKMYAEIFNSGEPQTETWFVAFIRRRRSMEQFWQSSFVVNVMRLLADEYGGKVRFAYVNSIKSEKLKETFGVRTLPQCFLYIDGVWYEQHMMQILYGNIAKFIEGEYKNEEKVYQEFETPSLLTEWQLKFKYVYNYIWRQWFDTYSWTVSDFCRNTKVYDDKNIFQVFSPHLSDFFKLMPAKQVNIVCGILLVLALTIIFVTYKLVSCALRCCCKKKERQDFVAPSEVKENERPKQD